MKENPQEKQTEKIPVLEMADQAMKNYEQALRAGLKLQEEANRCWGSLFNQSAPAPDWQKRLLSFTTAANGLLPANQKRMEELLNLVEKNGRTNTDLLKKAVTAAQTPAIAESQSKWMEVWTSSLSAARENTETMAQISCRAIDSWIDLMQKGTEVIEVRVPKAA
jgi:hypothetical protein